MSQESTEYKSADSLPAYAYDSTAHLRPYTYPRSSVHAFFDDTRIKKKKWYQRPYVIALLALCLLAVVALGVGLGVGHTLGRASTAATSSGGTGSGQAGTPAPSNSSSPSPTYNITAFAPLPKWNWTDPSQKLIGISLGNYLVLERWMSEDWFVNSSSPDAWDEWTFSNFTGSDAAGLLQAHWDSWVTEADVDTVWKAGINTLRIPTGYWAWIQTEEGEPYVQAGQLDRLERVMSWAYKRGMYVLIDLHGLPGSQNGEQQSGHNTTDVRFYQPAYQSRADATLSTALGWISASPYRSTVAGIEVCNEPVPNSADNFSVLRAFYERSYAACTQRDDPVPMIFHHGYPDTDHLAYWLDFVTGKDPNYLILEDHPYPGNFPLQTDSQDILAQVCQDASSYQGYPVPVAVTEWSLTTGLNGSSFETRFYEQQVTAWAWSAGGVFWSLRANQSLLGVAAAPPEQQRQYSFLDLLGEGVVPLPQGNQTSQEYLQSLQGLEGGQGQGCGPVPGEKWGNASYTSVAAEPTYTSGELTVSLPAATGIAVA
ncbi:glycoside hydrolase [Dacryopinax primogenitus]|uniref:glucan 1,3-beta-glucosidase n=1 Tax=Dacryopinax primogenitus (strain DJM 731) TaxID=1858805 RepID=M5GG13_DACPD|nr:glycoside hydrolase [Dacryopinax primogenitus]EJU04688.1 glycoside hydrolase [Dacryopinax primogenitus]